jgi:phage baseplate assembly protein V
MSATEQGLREMAPADMERRLANLVRYGTVMEVDIPAKSVRIKSGDIETDWIKWPAGRAGAGKRRWDPPEVNEQVGMLSPTGDMKQAFIIPGLYRDDYDAPSDDPNEDLAEYSDGAVIGYNRETHTLTANLQSETSIIASRTSIKATRGAASIELTNAAISIIIGSSSIVMTSAGVAINGTRVDLN